MIEKKRRLPLYAYVKVPCSVISESWKISKSLLVTISKVTMKLHNVSFSNLKEIYKKKKPECMGSILRASSGIQKDVF